MKKNTNIALLVLALSLSCANFAQAQSSRDSVSLIAQEISSMAVPASTTTVNPIVEVSNQKTPALVAPVVEDPKAKKYSKIAPESKKINLKAIIFDPTSNLKAEAIEEGREMTKSEEAQYNIHEALHGQVQALTTKGLFEDKMKIKFAKGPIESIAPWIDYNGCFQNIWSGDSYQNSQYGINFNDIGINGKFRTKDDPASGKKTVFRVMFNVGKEIVGNTYLQSMPADIYVMRHWSKEDQVMLGYARASVGIEGGESPFTIPLFARSQISRTYGNVRTLGVKAQGQHKLYDYSAGFFSSGRFFKDFFPGPEFTGLVSIKPLGLTNGKYGKLTMGGSLNAGNAESHYVVGGAHIIYEYKRLKATAEYASADGSNGSTGFTTNQSEGFYGNIAYRVTPKLQLVARYDKFDPNKNKANDIRTEYTAGINYFIKEQAVKLMLNYVYYTLENGTYGSRIMAGTQFIL